MNAITGQYWTIGDNIHVSMHFINDVVTKKNDQ